MVAAVFLVLLLLGVPISLVLALTAAAYIQLSGNDTLFLSYVQQLFSGLEKYGLLAIPLFMLVGELMNEGGITKRLIRFASVFIGAVRGGLAYINLIANMMMASIVGSAAAQIAVMTQVMVPEMERQGYDRGFAAATTAAGGLLSPIIPPSMLFVIFGVLAQIPIGDMFIAGIVPGLLMGLGFLIAIAALGFKYNYPRGERMSAPEIRSALLWGLPAGLVPITIIGGILGGLTTPTESAALACLTALALGVFVYRDFRWRNVGPMLVRLGMNASVVLFLIATANVFGWVIVFEQIPQAVAAWLQTLTTDPFVFMLLVNVMLLFVGTVIDGIAAIILVVPILLPIAQDVYGISPFHFGVVVCINLVLGLLTPPVGAGLFIAARMANVAPTRIFVVLLPFLATTVLLLVLLSWQPWLVTGLIE